MQWLPTADTLPVPGSHPALTPSAACLPPKPALNNAATPTWRRSRRGTGAAARQSKTTDRWTTESLEWG